MASKIKARPVETEQPTELDIDPERFSQWVNNLSQEKKWALLQAAEEYYSVIEFFLYCRFLGYNHSVLDLEKWFKANYPKPDHRKLLMDEVELMKLDIEGLRESVESGVVKRDAGVARIASMQKELRGAIAQLDQFANIKDKKGLILAGADRVIREILYIFKDDPLENSIEEACNSAWVRINNEF